MPKISILIPVYAVEQYIERCCISVFEQTYKNFEVIFVNDCSPDNSKDVLLSVIEKYSYLNIDTKVIDHSENQGISAARQTLLNAAVGDYILYVDSDDYIAANMLELFVQKINENNADVVCCDFYESTNGQLTRYYNSNKVTNPLLIWQAVSLGDINWTPWDKIIRRSIFIENHISWPIGVNVGEDLLVISKVFYYAKKIDNISEPLYYYNRDNENSIIKVMSSSSRLQNLISVQMTIDFFEQQGRQDILESLIIAKLMSRYLLLQSFNRELIDLVEKTFPETRDKVFTYKHTVLHWKVLLFLLDRGFKPIVIFFIQIIKYIKSAKNRLKQYIYS